VSSLIPARPTARRKLWWGAVIVMIASLPSAAPFNVGPFGTPWPLALIWAALGWASLGPMVVSGVLLFALGLWLDALTGAPLGSWAFVALVAHGSALLQRRGLTLVPLFVGHGIGACAGVALAAAAAALVLNFARGSDLGWLALILPL
jgi:hypothetical protein